MHLLVVTGFWPTQNNPVSGIFVAQQVAAFTQLGHKVTVAIAKPLRSSDLPILDPVQLELPPDQVYLHPFRVLRVPEQLSGLPGAIATNINATGLQTDLTVRHLMSLRGSFDGCVIHGLRYLGLSLPAWRRNIDGRSLVVLHGVDPFASVPRNSDAIKDALTKSLSSVSRVVVVGKPLVPHALSYGIGSEMLSIIPNGTFLPNREDVHDWQRGKDQVRRVVSVSNLLQLKGIDLNIKALASISEDTDVQWEYVVVGDGPERRALEQLAQELRVADRVMFLGRLSYVETMRQIGEADIFSLPSWREAFGIVYLEAMARMRPVIGCFENGAADIVADRKDGILVRPKSVPALRDALEELLSSPQYCTELGRQARGTAEKFSWQANAEQMIALLNGQ